MSSGKLCPFCGKSKAITRAVKCLGNGKYRNSYICENCKETWGTMEQIHGKAAVKMEQLYQSRLALRKISEGPPNISQQKIKRKPAESHDIALDAAKGRQSTSALQSLLVTWKKVS